jgi:lysophospholipid acyltransferase (LPLAT)-like uncharacterized protein
MAAGPRWSFSQRAILKVARTLGPPFIVALGNSLKVELPMGIPAPALARPPEPAIYVFWHRCILPATWYFRRRGFGVLISQHFDGEWITQIAERLGYIAYRGSSRRGGREALAELTEAVAAGCPIVFTVDGPRGPRFRAKAGPIYLARATGAPIYAFHVAMRSAWEFNSWDRMQIPKPGSLVRGVWTGPIWVPPSAGSDELEQMRIKVEEELNRLRVEHDAAVGARPIDF